MKTTTEKAVIAFNILYGDAHRGGKNPGVKLGKMKDGDKFNMMKVMKELKPVATDYFDFMKDSSERLRPEGFEEIQTKLQSEEELTPDEKKVWEEYNKKVQQCVEDELKKEVEFTFQPLSEEGFKGLLSSNDLTLAEIMAIGEILGE